MASQKEFDTYVRMQTIHDRSKNALLGSGGLIAGGIGLSTFSPEAGHILSGLGLTLSIILSSVVMYTNREIGRIEREHILYGSKK